VAADLGEILRGVDVAGEAVGDARVAPLALGEEHRVRVLDQTPQRSVRPRERSLRGGEHGRGVDGMERLDAPSCLADRHIITLADACSEHPDEVCIDPWEVDRHDCEQPVRRRAQRRDEPAERPGSGHRVSD